MASEQTEDPGSLNTLGHDLSRMDPDTKETEQQNGQSGSEPEVVAKAELHQPNSEPAAQEDFGADAPHAAFSSHSAPAAAAAGEAQHAAGIMQEAETTSMPNLSAAMHAPQVNFDQEQDLMPPHNEALPEAASPRMQATSEWESADELPQHQEHMHANMGMRAMSGAAASIAADPAADVQHAAGAPEPAAAISMQAEDFPAQALAEDAADEVAREGAPAGSSACDDDSDDGFGDFEEAGDFGAAAEPASEHTPSGVLLRVLGFWT